MVLVPAEGMERPRAPADRGHAGLRCRGRGRRRWGRRDAPSVMPARPVFHTEKDDIGCILHSSVR